jgi:hypothetical protein
MTAKLPVLLIQAMLVAVCSSAITTFVVFKYLTGSWQSGTVVVAQEFQLRDESGKRASLYFSGKGKHPCLEFFDQHGRTLERIGLQHVFNASKEADPNECPDLFLSSGDYSISLDAKPDGAWISVDNMDLKGNNLGSTAIVADQSGPRIEIDGQNPQLEIQTDGKSRAVLGCTKTSNEQTNTSTSYGPSTLTLYAKDGTVIWQKP